MGVVGGVVCVAGSVVCCVKKMRAKKDNKSDEVQGSEARLSNMQPDTLKWTKADSKIDLTENCAICLDNRVFVMTKCGHSYHPKCLYMWGKKGKDCPLCKSKAVNPLKYYCRECGDQYVEVGLRKVMEMRVGEVWRVCTKCKEVL